MENDTNLIKNHIPKKIHYVWMGNGKKSADILKCINSWKKFMPDYEIVEWNETNFDVNAIDFTREAYAAKKWAFVSDAVRVYALKEFGGVYFDTDVELFAEPKDLFCNANAVFGFDNKFLLSTGVLASVPHHPVFEDLWSKYETSRFAGSDVESTINTKLTFIVLDYVGKRRVVNGLHKIKDVKILPKKYFSGNEDISKDKPIFAVHHFTGSWKDKTQLTFFQFLGFAIKCRLLRVASLFTGNKRYIELNDAIWRNALDKTAKNIKKHAKIYKVL